MLKVNVTDSHNETWSFCVYTEPTIDSVQAGVTLLTIEDEDGKHKFNWDHVIAFEVVAEE